jgi:hypothetical protein
VEQDVAGEIVGQDARNSSAGISCCCSCVRAPDPLKSGEAASPHAMRSAMGPRVGASNEVRWALKLLPTAPRSTSPPQSQVYLPI